MALTPRQWKLYELLKENSHRWLTQLQIQKYLSREYPYDEKEETFHDSTTRIMIMLDIKELNNSDVIQKIILSTSHGNKIANEEEYKQWSRRKWISLKKQIARMAWKDKKAKLDGQMKLVFGGSMERDYYEAFIKDYKDDLEDK